jgi:hypothetical protein
MRLRRMRFRCCRRSCNGHLMIVRPLVRGPRLQFVDTMVQGFSPGRSAFRVDRCSPLRTAVYRCVGTWMVHRSAHMPATYSGVETGRRRSMRRPTRASPHHSTSEPKTEQIAGYLTQTRSRLTPAMCAVARVIADVLAACGRTLCARVHPAASRTGTALRSGVRRAHCEWIP